MSPGLARRLLSLERNLELHHIGGDACTARASPGPFPSAATPPTSRRTATDLVWPVSGARGTTSVM